MRTIPFICFLTAGCASNVLDHADRIECDLLWTSFTGDELLDEIAYYDSVSPDAIVVLSFSRVNDSVDATWDLEAPTVAFSIESSEVADDTWVDVNGNPLHNTVFSINLTDATADEEISSFFDDDGFQDLEEGEGIWFHIVGGNLSFNMYLTTYGYEEESGYCTLIE